MSQSLPLPPPGFDDLTAEEKLDYLHSLWDRMAAHPDRVPVPEWHRAVIDERLEEHRAHPDDVTPWDEVRESIRGKLNHSCG
jgi:putative addiction module component (TIGR02574 family)